MPPASPVEIERFLAFISRAGAFRSASPDHALRERLMADRARELPDLSPSQASRLAAAIDRACGVRNDG